MPISEAERKRLARARAKAEAKAAIREPAGEPSYLASSFGDFLKQQPGLMMDENLDAFGVQIDGSLFDEPQRFRSEFERERRLSSLERSIGLVEVFLDAAIELATAINDFKSSEVRKAIDAATAALADLPRDDLEGLRSRIAELDRLKAIQSELAKPNRYTVPAIRTRRETNVLT